MSSGSKSESDFGNSPFQGFTGPEFPPLTFGVTTFNGIPKRIRLNLLFRFHHLGFIRLSKFFLWSRQDCGGTVQLLQFGLQFLGWANRRAEALCEGQGYPKKKCVFWAQSQSVDPQEQRQNARRHLAPHTVHHPHDLLYIDQHRSSSLPESKKSHWRGKGEVGGKTPWNQMRKRRSWSGTLLAQKVVTSATVQFAQFPHHFCPGGLHLFKVAEKTKVKESLTQFLSEGSTVVPGPRLSKPLQFEHPNDNDRPDRHVIQGFFRWVQMVWACAWLDTSSNVLIISYDS